MNQPSAHQSYWPTVVPVVVAAGALVACLLFAGYLYLPTLVTDRLPVAQIQELGFADFTGRVSRIGLQRTMAGPFTLGPLDRPAIAIRSIALDYQLGELRRKKIRSIRINDVTLNVSLGPHGLVLPGRISGTLTKKAPRDQLPAEASSPLADMLVEKIELRSGMVNLAWRNATYKIPFEADLKPDGRDMMELDARVRLFARDQHLMLAVRVNLKTQMASISLDPTTIALDPFADLIHLLPRLDVTGEVAVQAKANLSLNPLGLSHANVDLTWRSGRLAYASVLVEPGRNEAPAVLSAVSENLKTWQIRVGGLQLQTPAPMAVDTLTATVDRVGDMRTVAAQAELTILPGSIERTAPILLKTMTRLPLRFDFRQGPAEGWSVAVETLDQRAGSRLDPLEVVLPGVHIHSAPPRFNLTAKGDGQRGTAHWQLDLNNIRATAAGARVHLPSVDAQGQLQFKYEPRGSVWVGDARIQLSTPTLDGNGMAGKLDALTLSARFQQQGGHAPEVDARLGLTNGQFHHQGSGLSLSAVRLDLPFRSDAKATDSEGTFSIARVFHNQRSLGTIHGWIGQRKEGYAFGATQVSDLFPGMQAGLGGNVFTNGSGFPNANLTFQILPYGLPAESDLGRLIPAAKGVTLSGTVAAQGKASISPYGVQGSLDVAMVGGKLKMAEKKIAVEGIDTILHFPELPRIRSGPAQQILFTHAAMGGIVVNGGTFDVQVESENTLFVEKGRLYWCGGKVDAQSLRITAGRQDYNMTFYCQRLGLSRILEQLGSVNAKGTGTVNGRIPISYRNGSIRFDDGFLFSTPGEPGQIQLTGTEMLTRGIPAGTPQFAQVELAQAALKDYAYTWAKLGLESEGEDLVMRLQFDGKPANPLPFVYKKELGSFVRIEAGAQGSVFQGIGLDVNLRLPLNQLLQYKDMVNMIQ